MFFNKVVHKLSTDNVEKQAAKLKPKTGKQLLNTTRTVHIVNARGSARKVGDGTATFTLRPGYGVKDLKKMVRERFGKVSHSRLGTFKVQATGKDLTAATLVDGVTLAPSYTFASGNPANLYSGGFGIGRRSFYW